MKTIIVAIITSSGLTFASSNTDAATIGGPFFNKDNGHTYYLLSSNTWTASEGESLALGGHLVTINNAAENQYVLNAFFSRTSSPSTLWIGLNDAASSGNFVWSSGEPVTFTNWFANEPNNIGLEHYVNMVGADSTSPGQWNNFQDLAQNGPGGSLQYGVVEVVPEPSTWATLIAGSGLVFLLRSRKSRMKNHSERSNS